MRTFLLIIWKVLEKCRKEKRSEKVSAHDWRPPRPFTQQHWRSPIKDHQKINCTYIHMRVPKIIQHKWRNICLLVIITNGKCRAGAMPLTPPLLLLPPPTDLQHTKTYQTIFSTNTMHRHVGHVITETKLSRNKKRCEDTGLSVTAHGWRGHLHSYGGNYYS